MCAVDRHADTRVAAATGSHSVPAITEAEFVRFQTLIQRESDADSARIGNPPEL
jgi:hypothetical protein